MCARGSLWRLCVCVCIRVYMCLGGWISMWTMSLCVSLYARRKINFLLSPPSLSLKSNNQFLLYTFFLCVFLPYIAFFPLWLLLLLFYSDHDFTRRVSKLYVLWSHTKKKWHSFIRVWECVFFLCLYLSHKLPFFFGVERNACRKHMAICVNLKLNEIKTHPKDWGDSVDRTRVSNLTGEKVNWNSN